MATGVTCGGYNLLSAGKERQMGVRRSISARFDERLFEKQLWSLRERSQKISRMPPVDLTYTAFMLRLLWVAVVVPFLAGAACAFLLSR